jgi:hypothetical protein
MKKAKTCILHVGTEKTGTTALQRFLGLNHEALLKQGIFVPRSIAPHAEFGILNHIDLTIAASESVRRADDLQQAAGIKVADDLLRHRGEVEQKLADELNNLSEDPTFLLLSNEHIHSRLRLPSELFRLRGLLQPFCEDFRVIVYLRPQFELAESVASTAVRNGQSTLRLVPEFPTGGGFDPILGVDQGYFDYHALLERLSAAFGSESIAVRLYSPDSLSEGDIVKDFFQRMDVETISMIRPGRPNQGLGKEALSFLMNINRHFSTIAGTEACRQLVVEHLDEVGGGAGYKPDRPSVLAFMQKFADSNEKVRRRWFPDRPQLFSVALDRYPDRAEDFELSERTLYGYIAGLLAKRRSSTN